MVVNIPTISFNIPTISFAVLHHVKMPAFNCRFHDFLHCSMHAFLFSNPSQQLHVTSRRSFSNKVPSRVRVRKVVVLPRHFQRRYRRQLRNSERLLEVLIVEIRVQLFHRLFHRFPRPFVHRVKELPVAPIQIFYHVRSPYITTNTPVGRPQLAQFRRRRTRILLVLFLSLPLGALRKRRRSSRRPLRHRFC